MWRFWVTALVPLAALQVVDHDSKEGPKESLQEFQEELTGNKTVPENETSTPSRSAWLASTTAPLLTMPNSTDYKANPPIAGKPLSASFYAKYIAPPLIVLVILLALFLMYRRKRGREIHSSMESINESSDTDNEVQPSVEQATEISFLPKASKPLPEDSVSIPEADAPAVNQEKASRAPKQLPAQA